MKNKEIVKNEYVILVDRDDNETGKEEKLKAHDGVEVACPVFLQGIEKGGRGGALVTNVSSME